MHLKSPIFSYMQPGRCYGQAGDEITVISVHHQVAIVENMDKQRFPAPLDALSESPLKSVAQPIDPNYKVPKRTIKAKKISQPLNELF